LYSIDHPPQALSETQLPKCQPAICDGIEVNGYDSYLLITDEKITLQDKILLIQGTWFMAIDSRQLLTCQNTMPNFRAEKYADDYN